ncbi:hypothetical protein N665_1031s0003 [Sinapis alba]|nr:hypothetical protein N665_1031s0003 [Sinapis alba]
MCCMRGKIKLPLLKEPPAFLQDLLTKDDAISKHYQENIRALNMMFSFTSLGGKIDNSVNMGKGPKIFKLHGENFHLLVVGDSVKSKIREDVVEAIMNMLRVSNVHVKTFRNAMDIFNDEEEREDLSLLLIHSRLKDGRVYNLPTSSEVAALVVGDFHENMGKRDIILEKNSGKLKRINELHPCYLPLQYPLIFPYGEDGFRLGIQHGFTGISSNKKTNISMREFFAYWIQVREVGSHALLLSSRLLQQFLVDAYTMIERHRLRYIQKNQSNLRTLKFRKFVAAANDGHSDVAIEGNRIIIPSSFTGGPRYMHQMYLDTMSICKYFGFPDLFITFTCNPKWPEMTRYFKKYNLKSEDRPDLCCRLFKIKLDSLMDDLTKKQLLGKTVSAIYTIEFQKRGLPHAHILLFMDSKHKLPNAEDIDRIISAEIPNKADQPRLYDVVKDMMIHGPCGKVNKDSPCMQEGKCTKFFPRKHVEKTTVDDQGYPKKGIQCDNRFVVPYNKELLLSYNAHINVEWCNQPRSIKYLFKYINKGQDRVTGTYFSNRYLSACESTWRILAFPTQYRSTPVEKLTFHLEGEQPVVYKHGDSVESVMSRVYLTKTMFLAWFDCCFAFGRLAPVSPNSGQLYYLRVLINKVKGPRCYNDIKTNKGIILPSYEEACYELGLLDDDKEYIEGLKECSYWASCRYVRHLFAMMLLSCSLSMPKLVWESTKDILSEDVLYMERKKRKYPDLILSEEEVMNATLVLIEKILRSKNSSLSNWDAMPKPVYIDQSFNDNNLLQGDLNYPREELRLQDNQWVPQLTDEKNLFVYGFGGTWKTFLWNILSAALRSKGEIVLNVASSGIASLLLPGGRTAHSRFGIPINPHEFFTCNIEPGSHQAELVGKASLIIWDEAPMMSKHCFEALDRSLLVVFGGAFRQILPVIPRGNRADIVMATLNSSYLWKHCKVLQLTKNMRLFSEPNNWILDVGDGKINEPNSGETMIDIPKDLLITTCTDPIEAIVYEVYGNTFKDSKDPLFFQERAMLCPTNEDVDIINNYMLDRLSGEERTYFSSDSIDPSDKKSKDDSIFSPEFLNSMKTSRLPNHALRLRIEGLCNGTRLHITQLAKHILEAKIITGKRAGESFFLHRILIEPSDSKLPFKMRRSQGQTLSNVGLFLPRPVFSHGQLYVAVSRVKSRKGLKILIIDKDGKPQESTMNIVFKEVFQNLFHNCNEE